MRSSSWWFLIFILITFLLSAGELKARNWELIWSDEFEGTELDESKWSYQYGTGASEGLSGWGNAELQYYTDREQNVFVEDGKLHVVAREESHGGMDYTSARLRSIHQGDWRYGRFEVRAKMPKGQGIWPAIWMMPTDAVYGRWPASGEIDIMELVGHEPDVIHGTIHYGPPHRYSGGTYSLDSGDFSDDFHTFAIEWENGEIRWYVDDVHYHTETGWFSQGHSFPAPFEQRFHFLLNVAVGGNWPGSPDHTTEFPQQMVIDYVRVYHDTEAQHSVSLPLIFEDRYFDFEDAFTGFEGGSVSVVENPDPDDVNSTGRVGKMVKDGGAFYGGAWFEAERPFSFSDEHNEITMKIWSPREDVPILVKLEQSDGDEEYEIVRQTTTSRQWEMLTWDVSAGAYQEEWDIITLIFDFEEGQIGDGSKNFTWYFDELDVFGADLDVPDTGGMLPVSLPLTFEDYSFDWERAFTGFSGGEITVVENPDPDEVNDSDWVGRMVKSGGAFWGGAFMHVNNVFVFDEDNHTITMKVWSPRKDVPVLMKVEQQNGVLDYEIAESTTTNEEWEEMTWDMSGAGFENQWDLITLIFDFEEGQIGDGSENYTWYFDDLHVFAGEVETSSDNPGGAEIPAVHELHQNYPNPFNPITNIMFDLPQQTEVRLDVFNVMGQRVATLANGEHQAGRHSVAFDASRLSSGVYVYRLQAGPVSLIRKMTLIQ